MRCEKCGPSKSLHASLRRKRPILLGGPKVTMEEHPINIPFLWHQWTQKTAKPWKNPWIFLFVSLMQKKIGKKTSFQTHTHTCTYFFLLCFCGGWFFERRVKLMVNGRSFQCFHHFSSVFLRVTVAAADWSGLLRSSQFVGRALGDHPTWRALPGWTVNYADSSTYCI